MNQYFACLCNSMSRNSCFQFYSTVFCFEKRIQTIPLASYLFDEEETSKDKDHKKEKRSCRV